jgi:hypothetical protein
MDSVRRVTASRVRPGPGTPGGGISIDLGDDVTRVIGMRPGAPAAVQAAPPVAPPAMDVVPQPGTAAPAEAAPQPPRRPMRAVSAFELAEDGYAVVRRLRGDTFLEVQQEFGGLGKLNVEEVGVDLMTRLAKHCVEIYPPLPPDEAAAVQALLDRDDVAGAVALLGQHGEAQPADDIGALPLADLLKIVTEVATVNFPKPRSRPVLH